ncbi:MAG: YwaF family protein [Solobacterium sp.]|nr:YwaF family protein [Solobacterium sp.]
MNRKYFWTHKNHIPEGIGYGQFTPAHFVWIAASAMFVAVISFVYSISGLADRYTILRTIAAILIIIDVIKLVLIGYSDVKVTEYLPLELCSFAAYFIVIDSIFPENTITPLMLLIVFLPAAIMAVAFPTTQALPSFNFYTIHQFLYHDLIIAYVISRFISGEIDFSYLGAWISILSTLALAGIVYVIDTVFNRNYMFLRGTEGNPLLEVIWKVTKGGIAYTGGLVCFCIIIIHFFFLLFTCIRLMIF